MVNQDLSHCLMVLPGHVCVSQLTQAVLASPLLLLAAAAAVQAVAVSVSFSMGTSICSRCFGS